METTFPTKLIVRIGALIVVALFGFYAFNKMAVYVDADKITITQDPIDGELHVFTTPGLKNQNFGDIVGVYPKWVQYDFDIPTNERGELSYENAWSDPKVAQYGFKVRFNDNGEAYIFGSIPVQMPMDPKHLAYIQSNQGSWESVEKNIVRKQLNSAVYQAGPLMSSKESSSERRSDFLFFVEDMMKNGVYQTRQKESREMDPITKDTIIVRVAEQIADPNAPGGLRRQSESEISRYGLVVGTPVITHMVYSPRVQKQIDTQQELTMGIQIAKAKALEAQQNAKTAASQMDAKVAEVRSDQMAIKEKAIVEAEQRKGVAELDRDAAEFYKQKLILEGEGESTKKKLLMAADGALNPKLDAYRDVQKYWADAWSNNGAQITPSIVSGGAPGSGGQANLNTFIDLMSAKTAKDLGLNLNIQTK